MSKLNVTCPSCQQRMAISATAAGKKVRCPHCKQVLVAPPPEQPASPASAVPVFNIKPRKEEAESIFGDPEDSEDEVFSTKPRSGPHIPTVPRLLAQPDPPADVPSAPPPAPAAPATRSDANPFEFFDAPTPPVPNKEKPRSDVRPAPEPPAPPAPPPSAPADDPFGWTDTPAAPPLKPGRPAARAVVPGEDAFEGLNDLVKEIPPAPPAPAGSVPPTLSGTVPIVVTPLPSDPDPVRNPDVPPVRPTSRPALVPVPAPAGADPWSTLDEDAPPAQPPAPALAPAPTPRRSADRKPAIRREADEEPSRTEAKLRVAVYVLGAYSLLATLLAIYGLFIK